jgi:uncharacterized membrane protein YedE/YeeE
MIIDINAFTPAAALTGGAMIGFAAALLLLLNGRVAGISGILGGLLRPKAGDISWRFAFVLGLIAAPMLYQLLLLWPASRLLTVSEYTQLALVTVRQVDTSVPVLVIAGLLVGIGTRYASGCTSGHGVCGLSRLSARSLVATLCFMGAGFATVFVTRHVIGG